MFILLKTCVSGMYLIRIPTVTGSCDRKNQFIKAHCGKSAYPDLSQAVSVIAEVLEMSGK